MNTEFTDEELEHYFRLQRAAEQYLTLLMRTKRAKQLDELKLR